MYLFRLVLFAALFSPAATFAHEFWVEPLAYQIKNGGKVQAEFKNGEEFEGPSLSFFDRSSARFDLFADGQLQELKPRSGDSPALDVDAPVSDGLVIVVHETTPSRLTYKEWSKFQKFVAHKDFPNAERDHAENGWSKARFRERYTRHVKALIAVGDGEGKDRDFGLKTEFISLTNPYGSKFNDLMQVLLHSDGEPRPDAQVEVFERAADGTVKISLHRTDSNGIAQIRVKPGHDYLFDAVELRPAPEATQEEGALVWETYWAALTFSVPD